MTKYWSLYESENYILKQSFCLLKHVGAVLPIYFIPNNQVGDQKC